VLGVGAGLLSGLCGSMDNQTAYGEEEEKDIKAASSPQEGTAGVAWKKREIELRHKGTDDLERSGLAI